MLHMLQMSCRRVGVYAGVFGYVCVGAGVCGCVQVYVVVHGSVCGEFSEYLLETKGRFM